MDKPQITIKDIARALNVSPSTVSRALKDNPDISRETRNLVWGIERSGFFNGREKWAKGFENQRV